MEKKRNELRMFVVERRDADTLIPIIQQNVLPGTVIVLDEWRSYSKLKDLGYKHFKVNHSKNFVDPVSKQHTQLIECFWGHAKHSIMRSKRGTTQDLLPYHLAEFWYRSTRPKSGAMVFKDVLYLLKLIYN
jgi:transposase